MAALACCFGVQVQADGPEAFGVDAVFVERSSLYNPFLAVPAQSAMSGVTHSNAEKTHVKPDGAHSGHHSIE